MINVVLCDDIPVQLELVKDLVSEFFKERGIKADIASFTSGEQLLADSSRIQRTDIYFLDMIMPGIKGIELGKELRKRGETGKIIYLTATAEYAVESYQVGAFFYILKPVSRQKISEVLSSALTGITRERLGNAGEEGADRYFRINTRNGPVSVLTSDILYVDIENRCPAYHMKDGEVYTGRTVRTNFADALAELSGMPNFYFAGSRLLVNLSRIEQVDKESVTFTGMHVLCPSRKSCEVLLEKLSNFSH